MEENERNLVDEIQNDEIIITDLESGSLHAKIQKRGSYNPHYRALIRWSLAFLIVVGSFMLVFLTWPGASDLLRITWNKPKPQSQSNIIAGYSDSNISLFANLFTINNIAYIYTFNDGKQSLHGSLDAVQASSGKVIWRYQHDLIAPPQLIAGTIYITTHNGTDAVQASNQALLWHNDQIMSAVQADNGILYITTVSGNLIARRASDGSLLWSSNDSMLNSNITSTQDGVIYATSLADANRVDALRSSDGTILWSYETASNFGLANTIKREAGILCIIKSPGYMSILRARDGTLLWQNDTTQELLGAENGLLYTLSTSNYISALNINDGTLLWHSQVSQGAAIQISEGVFYVSRLHAGSVGALRARDGMLLWHYQPAKDHPTQETDDTTSLFLQNGVVYLNTQSQGSISALSAHNGRLLWQYTGNAQLDQNAISHKGLLYVTVFNQTSFTLLALNANTGKPLWHYQTSQEITSISDEGSYVALSANGTVVALQPDKGSVLWHYQGTIVGS